MNAEQIREARQTIGLSAKDMAELLDASYSGYGKWERGNRSPDTSKIKLIKAILFLHERGELEEFLEFCKQ